MAGKASVFAVEIKELRAAKEVEINDDVIAVIAAVAAMEVEGVASMAGNITADIVAKLGMKKLSKGVKVTVSENSMVIDLSLNLEYGTNILEASKAVQSKVKSSVENMTGLNVDVVNVNIASVEVK